MSTNGSTLPKKSNTDFKKNPHFNHPGRAPYELVRLLQALPTHGSNVERADTNKMQQIQAAQRHAVSATETLLSGLEALGSFMFVASTNKGFEVDNQASADLGRLVQHIAVELQILVELQGEFAEILGEAV